ncbi:MAG: carbamoyl-phosphate synthase large subunit [Candidatus Omnitrophica bacterium]|nr:carbamoyl-phosphate synthase large subunit [Candidatus Omnitrophota bacterium]MBU1128525.1 carbamoyl-phosphate synthase large subunit [Candidatus Omnitrophota bacterium]MBU1784447.1 carbamoyl-phosphate synthase large subunit [Candidatus Omnitrophota bacterium]MBU1851346.1 carbamoyl-phosphate synthase large subunit [Candidatus Omnitrophota bacterium]
MPRRDDIHKILIIGSGPIIIGQACEFDYSGTQACKALKEEGYEVVLVNSNPATIMTDPGTADKTYIEPLTLEVLEKIIEIEKPDALLPNLGGQTALNLSASLHTAGILEKHNVEVIGVKTDAIERGEDRIAFKETMNKIGVSMAKSEPCHSVEEAEKIAEKLKYPVVLRPAYTMGGTGGGIAYNVEELRTIVTRGLAVSLVHQVLVEESVLGWEELELEVVRDEKGQKITVCFIENIDPMGVHTGDSFCVAPMLTVPEELQKRMQDLSYKIVDAIGVTGGTNVQFAHNPEDDRLIVIEINPRTSRSSALASKATGFPIARISTKLAVGITMDEIPYWKEGTLEKYAPSGDYVVIKFARWAFEKFAQAKNVLGTQMRAVGEVMSIGKTYKEAFQKAIRSLEIKRYGLGNIKEFKALSVEDLKKRMSVPSSQRIFLMYEALGRGITVSELRDMTKIGKWFINEMKELAEYEKEISEYAWKKLPNEKLAKAKEWGFSDKYLAAIFSIKESEVRKKRIAIGKHGRFEAVPVSGVENAAYYFSTYITEDSVPVSSNKKILILGGGPNRIGQGIEFDYTCVHAAFALREEGYESIMINCNPETVSTDYDTSDKLYFEPLTVEDVLTICAKEQPEGVIVQFGGQTPLNIAQELKDNGVKILGTSPESINLAEDREHFRERMIALGIPQPESGIARSLNEALKIAGKIGYPLMVRPSYVLGGRGMEIIYDEGMLRKYAVSAIDVSPEHPMLIDRFLEEAIEAEVDALCDGKDTFVAAVMEHIELAGVHSGDSACAIPPRTIKCEHLKTIEEYSAKIAKELNVVGLMNIQYAICDDKVYILEANPRASRTVPLVAKVKMISLARIATLLMLGKKIKDFPELTKRTIPYVGVKEAVFPFNMFPEVDPLLGPEMRSTGEVMGIADSFGGSFYKAQEATGSKLPLEGNVVLTVADNAKKALLPVAKKIAKLGFKIYATEGTSRFLEDAGVENEAIKKLHEGRPNLEDAIKNGEVHLIINTPIGKSSKHDDSYIRMMAIQNKIPYITSMAAASASAEGIESAKKGGLDPKSLQDYYKGIPA